MQPDGEQTGKIPRALKIRKIGAVLAAAFVVGYTLWISTKNSLKQYEIVTNYAFGIALPPIHAQQVAMVKKAVPTGSVIFYFMEQPESWQFGIWKRSLYPDDLVLPVVGSAFLDSPEVKAFRKLHHVRYVLVAGTSLPSARERIALPNYVHGIPLTLAELGN